MTMFCPLCDRQLEADEFQPAIGDVPDRWVCRSCDCCVNRWDDEFEMPDSAKDAPAMLG